MGNTPAALLGQVGRCLITGFRIIDNDAGPIWVAFSPVEKDDGDPRLYEGGEMIQVFCVEGEGGYQAIHSFMEEVMGIGGFLPIGLGGMPDDQVVTRFGGHFLDTGQYGADELAIQFMYDDADRIGLLFSEVAGKIVGAIAHFFGHIGDPFAGSYVDGRMVFQAPAYSGRG